MNFHRLQSGLFPKSTRVSYSFLQKRGREKKTSQRLRHKPGFG